ncbi:MAG: MBL fold metallo-hydrolase [Candidatus Woesearchaeota archaeon]
MTDSIIFLGTGKGGIVAGKQLRATGGILLRAGQNQFVIDPGPGSLVKARDYGINLRETVALIVTHHHLGHCNDLNAQIDSITYSGMDRQGVLISTNTVINGDENLRPYLTKYHRDLLERVIVVKEGQKVGINDVEITAIPADHGRVETIGLKFVTNDFTLCYTSDTRYDKEIIENYTGADILILNATDMNKVEDNLSISDAEKIIGIVKPSLAILTHFGISVIQSDPIYLAREIQKKTHVQTIAAKDGMILIPGNYAARSQQKILKSF